MFVSWPTRTHYLLNKKKYCYSLIFLWELAFNSPSFYSHYSLFMCHFLLLHGVNPPTANATVFSFPWDCLFMLILLFTQDFTSSSSSPSPFSHWTYFSTLARVFMNIVSEGQDLFSKQILIVIYTLCYLLKHKEKRWTTPVVIGF